MRRYIGRPVCGGNASGPLVIFRKQDDRENTKAQMLPEQASNRSSDQDEDGRDVQSRSLEQERLRIALNMADCQLERLQQEAFRRAGEDGAEIFAAQRELLKDEGLQAFMYDAIHSEEMNAQEAVSAAACSFEKMFEDMEDAYLKARAKDIEDICGRVQQILRQNSDTDRGSAQSGWYGLEESCILAAEDLTPEEVLRLDQTKVAGLILEKGSAISHTAILIRMLHIPALAGVPLWREEIAAAGEASFVRMGVEAELNGDSGELILKGDALYLAAPASAAGTGSNAGILQTELPLLADIAGLADTGEVLRRRTAGIGLFRSEWLFLGRKSYPSEEEQLAVYEELLFAMGERPVTIRTLDAGGDKPIPGLPVKREANPMLGMRGIRLSLTYPQLFKTQLRALFRAGVRGKLYILYPMITTCSEARQIRVLTEEVSKELTAEGVSFCVPRQGFMIETPAAALIGSELAQYADFFSIGTNDLAQYTLAADRGSLTDCCAGDPALQRLIRMVVTDVHTMGKKIGICGELALDAGWIRWFETIGADFLSVPVWRIPLADQGTGEDDVALFHMED